VMFHSYVKLPEGMNHGDFGDGGIG
jgi:hypothetical protein